jgi:hypothetical protein
MKNEHEAERIFNVVVHIGQWSASLFECVMEAIGSHMEWWAQECD